MKTTISFATRLLSHADQIMDDERKLETIQKADEILLELRVPRT